jgi:hypothetical protein
MTKVLKELGLVAAGSALGSGFFALSSLLAPPGEPCRGCISFGFPFTGFTVTAPFGMALRIEPMFASVLAFWLVIGLFIVEVSARVVAPHLRQQHAPPESPADGRPR